MRTFLVVISCACATFGASQPPDSKPLQRYGGRTLDEWQELIQSTDHQTLGSPEIVDGLLDIVQDGQVPWVNRRQAALTLGRIGRPAEKAVPVFREMLHSGEVAAQETTLWALKGLALLGIVAEAATPDVAGIVLEEGQPHLVRVNALETLGRIGRNHPRTLSTFIQVLRSAPELGGDPQVHKERRMAAAEGLWYLQSSAAAALPELLLAAQDSWPLLRLGAVTTIGEIGPAAEIAVPTLADLLLFDDAGEVREAAADALGRIGAASLGSFRQLIVDPDEDVRRLAIRGLSAVRPSPERQAILASALPDDSSLVRVEAAALLALDKIPNPDAVNVLLLGLTDGKRGTRIAAYRALQQHVAALRPHRERLAIMAADAEANPQSRTAAVHLLKLIDTVPLPE